jgi:hypothetical protein
MLVGLVFDPLADYFGEVMILDRDELLDDTARRPGVPQGDVEIYELLVEIRHVLKPQALT